MSSSASNGICSQNSFCSSDYACSFLSCQQSANFDANSEDIKSTASKEGDDPDSAELLHASDQDSYPPGLDNSAAHDVSCQGKTTAETSSKKRRLRMMDEDSDGVRIKIFFRVQRNSFVDEWRPPKCWRRIFTCLTEHSSC